MPIPKSRLKPMWETTDGETVRLYQGDVLPVLNSLPERSVQCVVTSPPYWGLRDYGTADWEGGDPKCDHVDHRKPHSTYKTKDENRSEMAAGQFGRHYKGDCERCGAVRIDQQIGSEPIPDCLGWAMGEWCDRYHVCRMVAVFRGVRRVLRDDGVVWLNYGDTYSGGGGAVSPQNGLDKYAREVRGQKSNGPNFSARHNGVSPSSPLPSGNLVGVPWRVALALQADGWVLRQDVIWHKPSPMPESVRNRCTKAHEYVFLLTKRMGYFYDAEAIKEQSIDKESLEGRRQRDYSETSLRGTDPDGFGATRGFGAIHDGKTYPTRNKRSVWSVTSSGYPGAHFATFPPKLIEPMIKAGTSEYGCCAACGTPWRRVVEEKTIYRSRPNAHVKYKDQGPNGQPDQTKAGVDVRTVGWEPGCECGEGVGVVPCVVLDPFMGSGTVADVCVDLGRRAWGVELNEGYVRKNQIPRVEGALMRRGSTAGLVPGRGAKAVKLTGRLV